MKKMFIYNQIYANNIYLTFGNTIKINLSTDIILTYVPIKNNICFNYFYWLNWS